VGEHLSAHSTILRSPRAWNGTTALKESREVIGVRKITRVLDVLLKTIHTGPVLRVTAARHAHETLRHVIEADAAYRHIDDEANGCGRCICT